MTLPWNFEPLHEWICVVGVGLTTAGYMVTALVVLGLALCGLMAVLAVAELLMVNPEDPEQLKGPHSLEESLRRVLWVALAAGLLLGAGHGAVALTCTSLVSSEEPS